MKFHVKKNGSLDTHRKQSGDSYELFVMNDNEEKREKPTGLRSVEYSRTWWSGESYDDLTHAYKVNFHDSNTANEFYEKVRGCVAEYRAAFGETDHGYSSLVYEMGSREVRIRKFPVFIAAFTVLASQTDSYGVLTEGLAEFRRRAPLSALEDPCKIPQNSETGTLVRRNDGSGFWGMSSTIAREHQAVAETSRTNVFMEVAKKTAIAVNQGGKMRSSIDRNFIFSNPTGRFSDKKRQIQDFLAASDFMKNFTGKFEVSDSLSLIKNTAINFQRDVSFVEVEKISELLNQVFGLNCRASQKVIGGPWIVIEKSIDDLAEVFHSDSKNSTDKFVM